MSTQQAILTSPNYLRRSLQNHHWDLTHFTFPIHLNYMSPYYIEKKWKERLQNWILNFCDKLPSDFSQYDSTLFVWNNTQIHGPVWFHVRSSSCSDFNPHLRITVWRRLPFDFQFLKPRGIFEKDYTFFNFSCRFFPIWILIVLMY